MCPKHVVPRHTLPNLVFVFKASATSMRTESLRIVVSPSRVAHGELRDFAQHLSRRLQPYYSWSVYNFTDEQLRNFTDDQRGAVHGMHLQMVLHQNQSLEMIRARRPHRLFYVAPSEDDE